ncbi:MAG: peptide deformylase [Betaproteobacteria bacterium]|nr:peptide deformylase [Betaproteobacteria bacterium]MBI2961250.1 peptide deformylase [Betaproteobacteria bacterium]
MPYLTILRYPDPRLYRKAAPVPSVDDSVRALVRDMAETMYAAPGVGLAATQVDVLKQVIVIDASERRDRLLTLINPVLLEKEGTQYCEEGCLSVPGVYERVERAARIKVRALGLSGESFELAAEEMLAVCIQHEMDHLEGKMFVDYLSRLKQTRIRARMQKLLRKSA